MKGSKEVIERKALWCSPRFKSWRLRKPPAWLERRKVRFLFLSPIGRNRNKGQMNPLPAELHEFYFFFKDVTSVTCRSSAGRHILTRL